MASLVLGAAGAVVGSIFGGPLGASLGWAIGSALGGMLEPKKGQEGPRLTDLHIQNSQYGLMIPIAYGTVRIAGNVIWQTDLQEHKQSSGGKGGGPKVTTYSYTVSFATMFCEGPGLGYRRIWANKRIVYSQVTGQAQGDFPFTPYYGTLTQLPDPTMEADKGVGFVPGYRGYMYIVLDDIPVEAYGNAIPSLEAEIIRTGTADLQQVNTWYPDTPDPTDQFRSAPLAGVTFDGTYLYFSDYGNGGAPGSYTRNKYSYDGTYLETTVALAYSSPNPGGDFAFEINPVSNSAAAALISHDVSATSIKTYWFFDGAVCSPELACPPGASGTANIVYGNGIYSSGSIYAVGGIPSYVAKWNAPDGVPDGSITSYKLLSETGGHTNLPSYNVVAVANDGTIWVIGTSDTSGSGPVWHLDEDLTLIQFWAQTVTGMPGAIGTFTVYDNYFAFDNGSGGIDLWQYDGGSTFTRVDQASGAGITNACVDLGAGYFLTSVGIWKIPGPTNLKAIVDDISDRCGLESGEYQTDDLTQTVNGYVIAQQADGRSCLEPLMTAYFCDAVESGPAIKYVNRGAAPDETIDPLQLGAYAENEEQPALVTVVRAQEVDLPRTINVSYFDINADYQVGTQLAKREVVRSTLDTSVTFAIVLSATEGKAIADRIMYDSWAKRRRLSFSLPRKYAYLEPTDVKIVNGYTVVITQRDEAVSGVIKFDAVATRSQIFGQSGAAGLAIGSGGFVPPTPKTPQATNLLMLDLPLIEDGDYPNGYYAAMAGAVDDTWGSANLYKSTDGGTTYASLLTNLVADTMGTASTVLADFQGGNIFDNINSVTVVIGNGGGTLTSTTELGALNGACEYLIGSEIVNAKTATLTAPSTYVLTGLLRGRRGTEWAMSSHGSSERFVVLPTSTNVNGPFAELGVSRKFKAVSAGTVLADATAVDFTNTGIALKPFAAVLLGGGRNAAGDVLLNWTPRTRTMGAWLDYVDVTLSDSDDWLLSFWTSSSYGTLLYSLPVLGAHSYTLSVADQNSFWGSPSPAPVYWSVQQIGSYQLGYEARGAT